MLAVFLSLIGVFGGLIITGAPFVIMMTMMGIISLAGIVVNNGVVLLDYTQLLIDRKNEFKTLAETVFWNVPASMGPVKNWEMFGRNFFLDVNLNWRSFINEK